MKRYGNDQLIIDLSRNVIAEVAPEELPLFRPLGKAYLQNPEKIGEDPSSGDEMLGFGVGETVTLITPYVFPIISSVVIYLAREVGDALKEESSALVDDRVKLLFRRFRPAEEETKKLPPPLSREQLRQVHTLATEKARQLNLPEEQAQMLADGITSSLAVAS